MEGQKLRRVFSRWQFVLAVVAATVLMPPLIARAGGGSSDSGVNASTGSGQAAQGVVTAGTSVVAATSDTPPVVAQSALDAAAQAAAKSPRGGPAGDVFSGAVPAPSGAEMPRNAVDAVGDLKLLNNRTLPPGGLRSGVNEPSADINGKNIFATGNWYAAFSKNNGKLWTYLDPFTIFGPGYCCDQVAVYDLSHNRQFWLLQYGDHLTTANSDGGDLVSWCFYNWTPPNFGLPSGYQFDYNHMAVSTRFLYVSTNVYGPDGFVGALVFRMPIDEMSKCGGFTYNWVFRSTEFSDAFVQPAGDTMYWGTNWTNDLALGSTYRVLRWADDSGTFFWFDRAIDPYTFMFFGGTQNCGGGVVLNWCQRTDSRMSGGGYLAAPTLGGDSSTGGHDNDAILGFAFNAKNDGTHPYPFTRRIYFRASDIAYLGYSEAWATWSAWLYPDLAADSRGHVGWVSVFGGSGVYPSNTLIVNDDFAPAQPWNRLDFQAGAGNACLNPADGLRRWGDYLTVRPTSPARYTWMATGFVMLANATFCNQDQGTNVQVKNVVIGRERDTQSYTRWKK
jgi:hypothetical protein